MRALLAFVGSLLRWPDGVVVKQGNTLRTQADAGGGGAGVLFDDQGRALLDHNGLALTDSE